MGKFSSSFLINDYFLVGNTYSHKIDLIYNFPVCHSTYLYVTSHIPRLKSCGNVRD